MRTTGRRPRRSSSPRGSRRSRGHRRPRTRTAATRWVWPLAAGRPRLWEIDGLVSRSERARAALSGDSIGYSVQAPVEELRATEQSATVAGRRLLLVGGEAAALLFAFAVLAARSMRRDLEAARRRLTWYGARRWQLRLLTVTESADRRRGRRGDRLARRRRRSARWRRAARGLPSAPCSARACSRRPGSPSRLGVVVARDAGGRRRDSMPARDESRFGLLDVAAVGSIALVVAALLGGAADESRLAESQNAGLVLLLLPGLIAFAAAVAGGAPLRAARPAGRPAAPPQRRRAPRGRDARPRAGCGRRHRRLPHARVRPGAARRGIPRHARPGRERSGVVRRPARHRRSRGPEVAHPRARRCAALAAMPPWREARRRCRSCGSAAASGTPRESAGSPCSVFPPRRRRSCTAGGATSRATRGHRSPRR